MGNGGFSVGHIVVLAMVGLFVIYIIFCATLGDPLVQSRTVLGEKEHKQLVEMGLIDPDAHYIFVTNKNCELFVKDVETTITAQLFDPASGQSFTDPNCTPVQ